FAFDCSAVTVPCSLTDISPAKVTRFVQSVDLAKFTAQGTGLDKVVWTAPEGNPAAGNGATFSTKWKDPGQYNVTATCGGTTKTATVTVFDVSIKINDNDTPSPKDDIVQVRNYKRFEVPCQIRLIGPTPPPPPPATPPVTVRLQTR